MRQVDAELFNSSRPWWRQVVDVSFISIKGGGTMEVA